jgi:hypothetical protein
MTKICMLFIVAAVAAVFWGGYETSKTTLAEQPEKAGDKTRSWNGCSGRPIRSGCAIFPPGRIT